MVYFILIPANLECEHRIPTHIQTHNAAREEEYHIMSIQCISESGVLKNSIFSFASLA